jgi:uncharacterized protein YndB with AHSA1/START domain/DNA-binding transcriptional ArsR family regulator
MEVADKVFKALADPTRRKVLDLLVAENGQTLGGLCEHLDMKRQSATQHIDILVDANLVTTVKKGREKLHFINPVAIHEVYERWVRKFERQRLGALHDLKTQLEGKTMTKPSFVYTTYIATTPERVWQALTDTEMMAAYWIDPAGDAPAHVNVSDWQPGSKWEHQRLDAARTVDVVGKVVESTPPSRLILTWARPTEAEDTAKHSRVTFDIEPQGSALVRLTVTHEDLDPQMLTGISGGWPVVLSNLKTWLETGRALQSTAVPA